MIHSLSWKKHTSMSQRERPAREGRSFECSSVWRCTRKRRSDCCSHTRQYADWESAASLGVPGVYAVCVVYVLHSTFECAIHSQFFSFHPAKFSVCVCFSSEFKGKHLTSMPTIGLCFYFENYVCFFVCLSWKHFSLILKTTTKWHWPNATRLDIV